MKYQIEDIENSFLKAFPVPSVLAKVASLINDQDQPLYKLGQEIAKDPVLTSKIISSANSPLYATKQKVSDLPHAISLLGQTEISMIVMRFISQKTLFSSKKAAHSLIYYPRKIWLHSLRTAHISRILVRQYKLPFMLESYMTGLLHDIGKNALAIAILPEDEKRIQVGCKKGATLQDLELEIFGFTHSQCSYKILKQMNLAPVLLQIVALHHEKMPKDYKNMNFILALANILSKFEKNESREDLEKILFSQFGMISSEIESLSDIYDELKIDMEFI